jgi:hypothetical protein
VGPEGRCLVAILWPSSPNLAPPGTLPSLALIHETGYSVGGITRSYAEKCPGQN